MLLEIVNYESAGLSGCQWGSVELISVRGPVGGYQGSEELTGVRWDSLAVSEARWGSVGLSGSQWG